MKKNTHHTKPAKYTTLPLWALVWFMGLFTTDVFAQQATITSIEPSSGHAGQIVNIRGANFQVGSRVIFGATEANIISISDQLIEVSVPPGATTRRVSVISPTGFTSYSRQNFVLSFGGAAATNSSSFESQIDLPAETGLFDVCLCDIDGDGLNDLIGSNSGSNIASVFQNNSTPGTISFVKIPLGLGASTLNTACGDLNGDGKPELIFSEGDDGERIFILVNNSIPGAFSFSVREITLSGNSTKRIEINDLNQDGRPELIITDQASNQLSILRNTTTSGNLNFDLGNIISLAVPGGESSAGLVVEDIDGDRRPDIVINQFLRDGGGIYTARNIGTGNNIQFTALELNDIPGTYVNLILGDIDMDGKSDLIGTRFLSGTLNILLNESNNGSIAWSAPSPFVVNPSPWGVELGDMDGDGKVDIIVNSLGSASTGIVVLNNNSTPGNLSLTRVNIPASFINRNTKVGDIDGDGRPDIAITSVDDNFNNVLSSDISILRNINCIKPLIEPEGPINFCNSNPIQLTTQEVAGATYEWRRDGNVEVSGPNAFFDVTLSGDYTVTILTSGDGCAEVSTPVRVDIGVAGALPLASIDPLGPVCIGGTLTLTATDIGATSYEWRGPQNFTATGLTATLNNFRFVNTGRYFLDIFSGTCIIETVSIVVEAVNVPDFSISQSSQGPFCDGDGVTLTVSPTIANYTYQWVDDNGSISGANNSSFSPTLDGNYMVEITDLINTTCPLIVTDPVEVNFVSSPVANFDIPSNSCVNSVVNFVNNSSVDTDATINYMWDFGDFTSSTLQNTTHIYRTSGDFTVKLTITYEGLSCQDEFSQIISIQEGITSEIIADPATICEGAETTLSLVDSFLEYRWSTGETTETITVTSGGTYEVTVKDDSGCDALIAINLETLPAPLVNINAEKTSAAPNETIQVEAVGLTDFNWEPAELFNDPFIANPLVTLPATTILKVTGQSESGCPGKAEIRINVELDAIGDLIVPKNFFSPNEGDNINATWQIENIEQFTQCKVSIYDQTGNLLFDAEPYLNDWDGTSKGQKLPSGVYYYVITCESEIVKSGSITLLR